MSSDLATQPLGLGDGNATDLCRRLLGLSPTLARTYAGRLEGRSWKQIADAEGVTPLAIQRRLNRARNAARRAGVTLPLPPKIKRRRVWPRTLSGHWDGADYSPTRSAP